MLGVETFLEFASSVAGAIGDLEATDLKETAKQKLIAACEIQADEQRQDDPVDMYRNAIGSVLAAGRAHLTETTGAQPDDPSLLGWRRIPRRDSLGGQHFDWMPQGDRIGWLSSDQIWLLPDESIAAADRMLREQGRSLGISRNALGKRLREKSMIETTPKSFTKVCWVGNRSIRAFVFRASDLLDVDTARSSSAAATQPTEVTSYVM
jgi:hypothetical protein